MDPRALLVTVLLASGASAQSIFGDLFGSIFSPPNRGENLPPSRQGNITSVRGTPTGFLGTDFINYFGQRQYSIRLVGGSNSREGNRAAPVQCRPD